MEKKPSEKSNKKTPAKTVETVQEKSRRKRPGPPKRRKASKRHRENIAKVADKHYTLAEGVDILKDTKSAKFDEMVEISMKLGVDPRRSDQLVRGSIPLPNGTGKSRSVLVFAEGDIAEEAKKAGADHVGGKELVDKIQKEKWVDFDIAIAHPSMMRFVGKLGRVLGPKGKMPSPKAGTVSPDIATAVCEFKSGRVEYRTDSGGNVHAPMGKKSFSTENLIENINTFIDHIKSIKPSTSKGVYIQKVTISSTMGPGVIIDIKS